MSYSPTEPDGRHVWVRNHGGHGAPVAGVVVAWQPTPVPTSAREQWVALVASAPFGDALLLDWVGADRLLPVRDPRPGDGGR